VSGGDDEGEVSDGAPAAPRRTPRTHCGAIRKSRNWTHPGLAALPPYA